nr:MAG TPA: hypothetical protein [Caudoviricetes sp.]
MSGRGSSGGSGGVGGMSRATIDQNTKILNIKRVFAKNKEISNLKFSMENDGVVRFSYTETKIRSRVHSGKMQSEQKNDTVKIVSVYEGTIGKDGLIRRKRAGTKEQILKRGKK